MSTNKLKPKGKNTTLNLSQDEVDTLKSIVSDCYYSEPDVVGEIYNYSFCTYCEAIEYKDHDKNCVIRDLQDIIKRHNL